MSMALAPRTALETTERGRTPWKDLSALVAARATTQLSHARSDLSERLATRTNGAAPVVVIVIGVAIVLAAGGLVAFLTTWCVTQGYAGFGAVLSVSEVNNGTQYSVSFQCAPWPWDA